MYCIHNVHSKCLPQREENMGIRFLDLQSNSPNIDRYSLDSYLNLCGASLLTLLYCMVHLQGWTSG